MESLAALRLDHVCPICGEPLEPDSRPHTRTELCPQCLAEPPRFIRASAFALYDDLRPAIHLMKFEGVPALADPLGLLLARAILPLKNVSPLPLTVVPVPLFRGKRAFNQSTLLAQSALRHLRKAAPDWQLTLQPGLLQRTRSTGSQFHLSPAQRRQNVRGAFTADAAVHGRHILLADDIYTTGATAAECTRVLLRAGAASVRIVTLARAGRQFTSPFIAATARNGPVQLPLPPPPI